MLLGKCAKRNLFISDNKMCSVSKLLFLNEGNRSIMDRPGA
jgi:hypothetical protein